MTAGPVTPPEYGASDLVVRFGRTTALRAVSLAAPAGQVTAVVGGDGAGKTTLLRCLAGALAPHSGTVRRPPKERTGYLPASSGLYPDLTVTENLDFRAQSYGMSGPRTRERSAEYLERAGLAAAAGRLAGHLSGGMRQKLGVIAAMLHDPELLILDEPTTGVDPVSRSGLWRLIATAAARGSTVVLATSYLDEAERCASVLVLDAGLPLATGTPDSIMAGSPGVIRAVRTRPENGLARRAWRRGGRWLVWEPGPVGAAATEDARTAAAQENGRPGSGRPTAARQGHDGPADGEVITPDLQDAVTVAALARITQDSRARERHARQEDE